MIGIFKQKNPANLLLLFVTGVLIRLPMFMQPYQPAARPQDGVFFTAILRFLDPAVPAFPLLYPILTYFFLFIQAVGITRFINNQRMTSKPTYLPGLAYLLITSLLPEWNHFSAPLLINTILLFILSGLFGTYNKQNVLGAIFNIGLALGVAGFLFIPSFIFIAWVLLALAVMRPFRINEWLICLLGITTPFYFYVIYLVVTGTWNQAVMPDISIGWPAARPTLWLAGSIFLLTVPFLAGGYYVQQHLRRMLINVRKGWSILLLFLVTALLLLFINTGGTVENWIMGLLPLAAFHGYAYLYAAWRPFPVLLFWLTIAFILAWQYAGPGW